MDGQPNEPLLQVQGVVKTFPGVRALDGVDLDLRAGEVHALVGENGAGKSTLIHLLAGVHQPDAGVLALDGKPLALPNPQAAARRGIAVVFQERSLADNLSVAENVFANRQPVGAVNRVDWRRLQEDTADLLRWFRLDVSASMPVRRLSPAQRQLVEILKALSLRPRILILDEPTSSLAAAEVALLFENVRRLKAEGVSFLYISHHLPEVFAIADRITVLRDGRRVDTCPAAGVTEADLIRRMVGRELTDHYGRPGGQPGSECFGVEGATRAGRFQDVSFSIRRGEIVGMAGLAGAGRTELARALFGAGPLDAGRLTLDGEPIEVRAPADAIRHRIAYLTEDRKEDGLFLDMAVRANCAAAGLGRFATSAGLMDEGVVSAFADQSVREFRIATPGIEQKVVRLSGGNQQKVLLSMWMAVAPRVLIVDEPTRGVDVGARSDIYHRLRALAASGVAILMISSDLPEILGMSDRVLVMRAGCLAGEFAGADATEEKIIACAAGVGEA